MSTVYSPRVTETSRGARLALSAPPQDPRGTGDVLIDVHQCLSPLAIHTPMLNSNVYAHQCDGDGLRGA